MLLRELVGTPEVIELERQLDAMFRPLGLDVEFSRHFVERLLGREKKVTIAEITASFNKLKKKYKKRLISAKKKDGYKAVLRDFSNDLNFVLAVNAKDELVGVTIMQKEPSKFHVTTKSGNTGDDLIVK